MPTNTAAMPTRGPVMMFHWRKVWMPKRAISADEEDETEGGGDGDR